MIVRITSIESEPLFTTAQHAGSEKDTLKAKTMAEQINATLDGGASLISDPRFQQVKLSIGFTVLSACGLVEPKNNYTDVKRWASLSTLLTRL